MVDLLEKNQPGWFSASGSEGPTLSKRDHPVDHYHGYDDNDYENNDYDDDNNNTVRLSTTQRITSKIAAKRSKGIFPSWWNGDKSENEQTPG